MEKEIKNKIEKSVRKNTKRIKEFVKNGIEENLQQMIVSYKGEVEDMLKRYGDEYEELITNTYTKLYNIVGSDIAISNLMKCFDCRRTKELRFERY